jgi:hypothetical protein
MYWVEPKRAAHGEKKKRGPVAKFMKRLLLSVDSTARAAVIDEVARRCYCAQLFFDGGGRFEPSVRFPLQQF